MHWEDRFKTVLELIICIAILGAFFGLPDEIITLAIEWGASILIGIVMSGISGQLVESFTGDSLKNITLTVPIAGFNFSVPLFIIATLMVRFWLFG